MKKLIAIALVIVTCCACIAGCGGDKYADLKLDVNGFGRNLLGSSSFQYAPEALDNPEFAAETLKIDTADLNTADGKPELFYSVSASSPEAVFVIGAKDAAAAKKISDGPIKDWIKVNRDGYANYGPEQVPKLDSAINRVAGRYVIVVVSSDNAAAKTKLTSLLDTALSLS